MESLKDYDNLIGPSVCTICDGDINNSVKVRFVDQGGINSCLDCLKKGKTKEGI